MPCVFQSVDGVQQEASGAPPGLPAAAQTAGPARQTLGPDIALQGGGENSATATHSPPL